MKTFFLSILLISGCTVTHNGYSFKNLKKYETIVGKTTKNDIINSLGEPTFKSEKSDTFFYMSQEDSKFLFIRHISVTQKSLILTFNEDGVLKDVKSK
jgi:outer membrane protein assembly factor BamE (lipoprotein component of BamABCDE complex)